MQIVYSSRAGSRKRSRLLIIWPSLRGYRCQHGQILRKPVNSASCPDGGDPQTVPSPGNVKPRLAPDRAADTQSMDFNAYKL